MSVFRKYIDNPRLLYCLATAKGLTRWISDELHLKMMYKALFGVAPDLDNPRSFNEKMQWLKLHNHVESYSKAVSYTHLILFFIKSFFPWVLFT